MRKEELRPKDCSFPPGIIGFRSVLSFLPIVPESGKVAANMISFIAEKAFHSKKFQKHVKTDIDRTFVRIISECPDSQNHYKWFIMFYDSDSGKCIGDDCARIIIFQNGAIRFLDDRLNEIVSGDDFNSFASKLLDEFSEELTFF